jgi:hypothetical protein
MTHPAISLFRSLLESNKTCSLFVCLVLPLLTSCESTAKHDPTSTKIDAWVTENKLSEASEAEVAVAKSSEAPWEGDKAVLGRGFSLRLHRGEIIGSRQLSTTSHYSLVDSNGRSLAKLPSRLARRGIDPDYSETKVWVSQDHELLLVYESRQDATGDREFHGIIYKNQDGEWQAHGVGVPHLVDRSEELRKAKQDRVPINPIFHYGPFTLGVINGAIVLLPANGRLFKVRPDDLKASHPFPFTIG